MRWILLMLLMSTDSINLVNGQGCVDKLEACAELDPSYYCTGQYYVWAYENCRLHCGLCDAKPPSVLTTRPLYTYVDLEDRSTDCDPAMVGAAVCSYKGQTYMQGETWKDGCDYSCTCLDATIGYYRCTELCPRYDNLPFGCQLRRVNECCSEPVCNFVGQATVSSHSIVGGAPSCIYKGQHYAQDETWKDGCSQKCTCTDASRGFYSCTAVCLRWDTLPSICHLEDPPFGLCCQQPRCPSSIQIQIPAQFVNEYPGYYYDGPSNIC